MYDPYIPSFKNLTLFVGKTVSKHLALIQHQHIKNLTFFVGVTVTEHSSKLIGMFILLRPNIKISVCSGNGSENFR